MRNKAVLNALLAVVLIACVMVGATLAYLTDTVEVNVRYAYGTVKITVNEPRWASQLDFFTDDDKAVLYPGRTFEKDPVVNAAANSEPCYVRLKVVIEPDLAKVVQIPEPNIINHWRLVEDPDTPNTYYYIYQKIVNPNETTPPAFTEVKVMQTIPGETDNTKHAEYLAKAANQSILVTAEAIQAATFASAADAFDAYDNSDSI